MNRMVLLQAMVRRECAFEKMALDVRWRGQNH